MTTLITGASSGIGEALALECAKRGETLFLSGRNVERLAAVAERCKALGAASVSAKTIDVADSAAMRSWLEECNAISPVERVFANAGVSTGAETEANVRETFSVNVGGVLNTVLPAIDIMKRRGTGWRQIIVTASIAGYAPLRACPSYSATKSCVKTWALALRGMLKPEGIKVSAVCPGFVRSRITDRNLCPMPFFMEADKAAKKILRGADRDTGLIAFPWIMRFGAWWVSTLPYRLAEAINAMLPKNRKLDRPQ